MRTRFVSFLLLIAALSFSGCKKDKYPIRPIDVETQIVIDADTPVDYTGCTVVTLQGEFVIEDGNVSGTIPVGTFQSKNPQLIMVVDSSRSILMLSRDIYEPGQKIVIDAWSSAMAMVTLHPLFSPVPVEGFGALKEYITGSEYFEPFVEQVGAVIRRKGNLYDSSNSALLEAFSTLLNDLCTEEILEEGFYPFTKASGGITNISGINAGPFKVELNGLVLSISNYALTPYYEGSVTYPDGQTEEMDIPSNDDYGVTSLVNGEDMSYGDPVKFDFRGKPEGDYLFLFDRTTAEAQMDYWCKIISNVLDGFGLPLEKEMSKELAKEVYAYLQSERGWRPSTDTGNILEWMETITLGVIDYLGSENFHIWAEEHLSDKIVSKLAGRSLFRYLNVVYQFYTLARGSVSSSMQVFYSADQPKNVFFVLNYKDGTVKAASSVSLQKVKGDNQIGVKGQRLNLPLEVKVFGNYSVDGSTKRAQALCKVRFSVVSGGGSLSAQDVSLNDEGIGSVYWTLGNSKDVDNIVRAVAIDMATGEELSDYVEFKAGFQPDAAITVRLDWDKTATDTDIDLHMLDPLGHHIYFNRMRCSCGGFLDRDDVKGPGPEHITYTTAKPGTYEVAVHHYPNGLTRAYTVAFTVTAYVGDRVYRSHGAVAYDQSVSIGTFTIGESRSVDIHFNTTGSLGPIDLGDIPEKADN